MRFEFPQLTFFGPEKRERTIVSATSLLSKFTHVVILLVGIWLLNLTLLFIAPGDITNRYWGPGTSQQALEEMRRQKGLDLNFLDFTLFWTGRLLRGDLGYSWTAHAPVNQVLGKAVGVTVQLVGAGLLLQFGIGIGLGVMAAQTRHPGLGRTLDLGILLLYATPVFCLAILAIQVFGVRLHWLPVAGMNSILSPEGQWALFRDRLRHLLLPALVLGLSGAAVTMRYVRNHLRYIIKQPYIQLARAKGLSLTRVLWKHAMRNALLPLITHFGLVLPGVLGGVFIVETIFAWPGMGRLIFEALLARDMPVLFAANFFAACAVIFGNGLADALYAIADPRVRMGAANRMKTATKPDRA